MPFLTEDSSLKGNTRPTRFQKPHTVHSADHGIARVRQQSEFEHYCELIAAFKLDQKERAAAGGETPSALRRGASAATERARVWD